MSPDINAARQYAFNRLARELKPHLSYHNLEHTFEDVLPNALRLAGLAGLNAEQKLLLATAAVYHDIGYPTQADGHEEIGAQIAAEALPQFGFSAEQIAEVQGMIRATALPQTPKTLSEQLLCDADLDLLGREDDFLRRNHELRDEMHAAGQPMPLMQWYEGQRNFVSSHRYHSAVARNTRTEGKQRVIALLNQRILNLRLSTFVASDLRQKALLAPADLADSNPAGYRTKGAALFADIAGFTALTEQLIEHYGPERGAEAVLQSINPLYDAIIPILYQFNGSVVRFDGDSVNCVIGFAGDSITCWLDGPDAYERAIACARAMHDAMATQSVVFEDGSEQQMLLKIGIASGSVRRMQVGDPKLGLYDVLAGDTMRRMAIAGELAQPTETVLCPITAERIGQRAEQTITVNTIADPDEVGYLKLLDYRGALEPIELALDSAELLPDSYVQKWVLQPVAERLAAGGFLAELRPAAALFVRFHGIDYDADAESGIKLDQFIRWVQQVLHRNLGYLIQLSFGDKGSYLYASFGAPRSFADNGQRAANAALDMRNAVQHFDFITQVELGLAQGRMWTGAYGSRFRSTYGVMSRATNLAARLMTAAAANEILVHESATRELTTYRFSPHAPIVAKGFDAAQTAWVLEEKLAASDLLPNYRLPLIGREPALAALSDAWRQAQRGAGRSLALTGEAGIGKTHLSSTFALKMRSEGTLVLWAQADQTSRDQLYDVWQQLFKGLFALTEELRQGPPAGLLNWLQANIADGQFANDERLPLLGDLLGLALPENETSSAFEPVVRREALFALLLAILEAYAKTPFIMVLDEAHLLDEGSQTLLLRILQSMRSWSLLIVLLRRPPEDDAAAWEILVEQPLLDAYELPPLDPAAMSTIVGRQLTSTPSRLLAGLLQRQTHGNPFYLESLVETLRDDEQIIYDAAVPCWDLAPALLTRLRQTDCVRLVGNVWELDPNADLAVVRLGLPDSVHRSVLTRVDRLPEQAKLVLKLASVIGHQFDSELLRLAHPQSVSAEILQPLIDHLRDRNLISALGPSHYQFRHHATQEATYDTLLFAQRKQLHRLVLDTLLTVSPKATAALARHGFEAQEWSHALPHLRSLGEDAQRLYANHQSVAHFERVIICLNQLGQTDGIERIHLALGESLIHLGRYSDALSHLASARDLAAAIHLPQTVARACRWTARAFELQGDYPAAKTWLDEGLAADQNESRESAELFLLSGLIESHQGNYDASQDLCDSAIVMAQHYDTPAVLGRAYNLSGILALYRGQSDQAVTQFTQALSTYRGCNDRRGEALALNQLANAFADGGDWQAAYGRYAQARAIFVETGDVYNRLLVDNNLGRIAQDQNRLDEALSYYDSAIESLTQLGGSAYAKGALHLNRGTTHTLRGELAAGAQDLATSRKLLESAEVRVLMPELLRAEATVALAESRLVEGIEIADASLALARELEMSSEEGHTLRVRGAIALAQQDLAAAAHYLDTSLRIMQENADLFGSAETESERAHLFTQLGQYDKAQQATANASEMYMQLGVQR